jgi:ligand-binding sensor domain-containing protein
MKKITLIFSLFVCFATTLSAQWQQTSGIYGGSVRCAVVSNANIFIGTLRGVYTSANNGASWTFASNGLPTVEIFSLATDGSNIYAGTRDKGLFLSTNNGQSWSAINAGINDSTINTVAIGAGKLFVGTYNGIYVSTNNGGNWSQIPSVPAKLVRSITVNGSNVLATFANGIYASTDNGITWTFIKVVPTSGYVNALASSGNKVVAGTGQGVFLSNNNGQTWTDIGTNQYVLDVAIRDNTVFAVANDALYVTSDNGSSWRSPSDGLTGRSLYSITLIGANILLGTSGAAFFMPINGNAWTQSNVGILDDNVGGFATSGGNIYATTGYGEVYVSIINSTTWTRKTNVMSRQRTLGGITSNPPYLFVCSGVDFYRSSDDGNSWTSVISIEKVFGLANNNGVVFAGTESGLFKSTDNGDSWVKIAALGSSFVGSPKIINNSIFAFTYNLSPFGANLVVSVNNGDSWRTISLDPRFGSRTNDNILIGTERGVSLLNNSNSVWTDVNTGLTNLNVWSLASNGNNIYAATIGGGIFLSNDLGGNWKAVNEGLTNKNVFSLIVAGNYLYAATDRGVFRRPLSELTVGTQNIQEEMQATLSPNPVSNQLTINISNALIGKNFTMTNIVGETMQSGILNDKSTVVSVNDLAKGIYFLHFIGTAKTIKFVKE